MIHQADGWFNARRITDGLPGPEQFTLHCALPEQTMYAVSHTYVPLIEAFVLEEAATNVRYFQEGARWWCPLGGHGQGRGRSQSNFQEASRCKPRSIFHLRPYYANEANNQAGRVRRGRSALTTKATPCRGPYVLLRPYGPQLVQGDRGWFAEDTLLGPRNKGSNLTHSSSYGAIRANGAFGHATVLRLAGKAVLRKNLIPLHCLLPFHESNQEWQSGLYRVAASLTELNEVLRSKAVSGLNFGAMSALGSLDVQPRAGGRTV